MERAVHGAGKYGPVKFSDKNAQVSTEKLEERRFIPEFAGQHGHFHRKFIDVRGTSYCTILCRLSRRYVVM